ncbi:hypothetical protein M2387_002059 [Klebsiella sp. BIGb0407]|nr:hypothetical protein [Klebsiella sp. BIGb0407]
MPEQAEIVSDSTGDKQALTPVAESMPGILAGKRQR